ncbi:MAG TPA: hypothetical protein DCM86_13975, partial [Verrucomicrobiales bacterium]|nr:hypothetical protein [Verrucomicrobiales bacterium]
MVPEGRPVSLIGMAGSTGPVRYQWQRNGTDIPDATNSLFLIPAAQITPNNGERYLCRLFGTTTSSNSPEILLTVTQDTTPPSVTRVLYLDATHLQVTFSEPVTAASITAPAAFALDGGVNILSAALTDPQTALLTTSPMIRGTAYQMTLSGIQDGILHPNTVPAGTRVSFTALELIPVDLGNPTVAGKVTSVPGGYDMTSSTKDIAGAGDQFGFNWEVKTGNFDVAVRVSSLEAGDPWAKAGLMARGGLTTASPFAMVVTTPGVEGTYFLARQTPGASTVQSGSLPPNPPETWLRLRREENLFTGFTSRDGENWARLGSTPLAIPSTLYLGLALTSHGTNLTAAAGFRDLGDATGSENSDSFSRVEPPGPSSRKTGVAITEIMYKPAPLAGITNNLEFVELYNSNPYWENIGGYRLAGDIQFTFPEGTLLQGGARIVVALDPEALQQARHITGVSGPYAGSLKSSGLLQLLDKTDAVLLEIPYSNLPPWPVGADGTGHSLVLARPSYGEGYAAAWDVSDVKGGSPGAIDPVGREPLRGVLINEFLASSTPPDVDFIELYNHTRRTVDLSGAWLSDSGSTNKFRIPDGTTLSPGGFIAFTEADLHFSLTAAGETIYLVNPANTRVIDAIRFEAQRAGISTGRFPDGSDQLYPLARTSAGKANGPILMNDIVINELLYKPISGNDADGFVELFNQGSQSVDLGGWKFTSGISYKFPAGTLLAPGGYLVVARDRTNLMARYPGSLTPANTLGNYSGKPTSDGGRVALAMPVPHITQLPTGGLVTNTIYPVVDEVTFGTGGRWGEWANGGGSSLELKDPRANHRLAYNWGDSDDTHKAPWTPIEATGIIDNSAPQGGSPINRLEVTLLGAGEYLLDNVEVLTTPSANVNRVPNPDFESGLGAWTPQGDHIATTLETTEGFQSSQSLHVRASARGDTGANRVRVALTTSLNPGATCTIRAKVRWLRGWPETVLRLKGNGFELAGAMQVPTNLGTPGQPNSQAQRNAAPAISDVHHSPVLPAAGQPVVVTARAQDPDGLQSLTLVYRLDPATGVTTVPMKDDGLGADLVAGDGLYSAYLPGQPAGTLAAFYIEATDKGTPPLTSRLPEDAPVRECLVRFGEPTPASGYATYHFLMTANNVKTWINRPSLSNERVEGTFVYGNFRAIYGISGKYAGSPYHQGFGSPVTDPCHYSLEFPLDDILLGTENFNKIHAPGNGPFDDTSLQREQTSYWMMRQMGLPWNYRRFVAFYFNGNRKQTFMEDSQTPGSDVVSERWPNDSNGNLYKLQPWFEFDDVAVTAGTAAGFDNVAWCSLMNFYTGTRGDVKKLARYRYNFLTRAANGTANDYTNVWDLTDAANTPPGGDYVANMKHFANMEQWMRTFAVQHSVGNWDSFGNRNSQNMYGYKPTNGKWTLMTWDFNIVLGNSGSDGPTGDDLYQYNSSDSAMLRIYQTPEFRRMYIRAFKEIIEGPMAAGSPIFSLMDAKYAEILA